MTKDIAGIISVIAVCVAAILLMKWVSDRLDAMTEQRCREWIAAGVVDYECRDQWELCGMYYSDCASGERYEWVRIGPGSYYAQRVP